MHYIHEFGTITVCQFPCLSDNYGYLIHEAESGQCAAVDTPDANAINKALEGQGWTLSHILNTHWHPDHTGGNDALKKRWGCEIIGPQGEKDRIPGADRLVSEGDQAVLGKTIATVIDTPGHTSGHIVYYFKEQNVAFVGDTLFALGCGRLFEGTPGQMWASLLKLRTLPEETTVFCAHEYTEANARFAVTADPENPDLAERFEEIKAMRAQNKPTVPTSIGLEKITNPFLRADAPSVQAAMSLTGADPVEVFAEVRQRKDNF